eukprot:845175_1
MFGSVKITVVEVSGDAVKGNGSLYCVLSLADAKFQTTPKRAPLMQSRVQWNEMFEFEKISQEHSSIYITCQKSDRFIGTATVRLAHLEANERFEKWYQLRNQKNSSTAVVLLRVEYTMRSMHRQFSIPYSDSPPGSNRGKSDNEESSPTPEVRLVEYFLISELKFLSPDESFQQCFMQDDGTKSFVSFRYPKTDRPDLPFEEESINMFAFQSNLSFYDVSKPPTCYHFALTAFETRLYGTSLVFWNKIGSDKSTGKHYEPKALVLVSRFAYLDSFREILRSLYMIFFMPHDPEVAESGIRCDSKGRTFEQYIQFICDEVPAPTPEVSISFTFKCPERSPSGLPRTDSEEQKSAIITRSLDSQVPQISSLDAQQSLLNLSEPPSLIGSPRGVPDLPVINGDSSVAPGGNSLKPDDEPVSTVIATEENPVSTGDTTSKTVTESSSSEPNRGYSQTRSRNASDANSRSVCITLTQPQRSFAYPQLDVNIYRELFCVLDTHTIVKLLCCIMCEYNMIFYSRQSSTLVKVQECLKALLFPLDWAHIYIPLLPKALIHVTEAPVPFMLGLNTSDVQTLADTKHDLSEIVMVNIDTSTIEFSKRLPQFPSKQRRLLMLRLRTIIKPSVFTADDVFPKQFDMTSDAVQFAIRSMFLEFLASVLGNYRGFLFFAEGQTPIFNTSAYLLQHKDEAPFLSRFIPTHLFSSFMQLHIQEPAILQDYVAYISTRTDPPVVKDIPLPYPPPSSGILPPSRRFSAKLPTELIIRKPNLLSHMEGVRRSLVQKSDFELAKVPEKSRVALCIEWIFSSRPSLPSGELTSIADLLKIPHWREKMVERVNAHVHLPSPKGADGTAPKQTFGNSVANDLQTGRVGNLKFKKLKPEGYDDLAFFFLVTLNECAQTSTLEDLHLVKRIVDVATVIFRDDGSTPRAYMITVLATHPLLQKRSFWDSVFMIEVRAQFPDADERTEPMDEDWCFQKIVSYIYEMVDLQKLDIDTVVASVTEWCSFCKLSNELVVTLCTTAHNLDKTKRARLSFEKRTQGQRTIPVQQERPAPSPTRGKQRKSLDNLMSKGGRDDTDDAFDITRSSVEVSDLSHFRGGSTDLTADASQGPSQGTPKM